MTNRKLLFLYILLAVLTPDSLLPKTAADADFDGNGTVGFSDFVLFAQAFGTRQARYDLDGDGTVNYPDFVAFAWWFGTTVPEAPADSGSISPSPPSPDAL